MSVSFHISTYFRTLGALILVIGLIGCQNNLSSSTNTAFGASNAPRLEIESPVTAEEYRAGLKKAKGLLLGNPFLTTEEEAITDAAAYASKIEDYINDERSVAAVHKFFFELFDVKEPNPNYNINEPANLAAKIYRDRLSASELFTAKYCVSDLAQGLTETPCLNRGRVNVNNAAPTFQMQVPQEIMAGVLTTQAFLARYDGANDFRRAKMAFQYALCSEGPDYGEKEPWTENPSATDPSAITMHPFYWSSINMNPTMNCTACHGNGLNKGRAGFTMFGAEGEIRAGQTVLNSQNQNSRIAPRTINDVEAATIALDTYVGSFGRFGFTATTPFEPNRDIRFLGVNVGMYSFTQNLQNTPPYANVSDMGRALVEHERFAPCMVTYAWQFASVGRPMGITFRPPGSFLNSFVAKFKEANFDLKVALEEILKSPAYLNK